MAEPDRHIRGGGGGPVIQTLRKRGARSLKKFFLPFGPQFGVKVRGGRGPGPPTPPLDPPLILNSGLHAVDSGFQELGS